MTIKISKTYYTYLKDLYVGYHVICVPDCKWVYYDEVIKAMRSGKLSDKKWQQLFMSITTPE